MNYYTSIVSLFLITMPLTTMGQTLTFVDIPISPEVLATTDVELIGLRAIFRGPSTEKCIGNDLRTLETETVAEVETLLQNQRKALLRGKTNDRRKLPNCADICRHIVDGQCVRINSQCAGWRALESNEEDEEMDASLDITTTTAAKEQEAPGLERKMNAAAIERCQLLKDATKIEFGLLSASNDVSNKCLAALENTITLECLLVV